VPFIDPKLQKLSRNDTRYERTTRKCYLPFGIALALPESDILGRIGAVPNEVLETTAEVAASEFCTAAR